MSGRNIGMDQLRILIMTASPTCIMLTADRSSRALVKRGLLRELDGDQATCITPAGLRALADAMEVGRVEEAIKLMKRDAEERRAKVEAKRKAREANRAGGA